MTVGFVDAVEIGKLFAVRQFLPQFIHRILVSLFPFNPRSRIWYSRNKGSGYDTLNNNTYMIKWYHPVKSVQHVESLNTMVRVVDLVLSNLGISFIALLSHGILHVFLVVLHLVLFIFCSLLCVADRVAGIEMGENIPEGHIDQINSF